MTVMVLTFTVYLATFSAQITTICILYCIRL